MLNASKYLVNMLTPIFSSSVQMGQIRVGDVTSPGPAMTPTLLPSFDHRPDEFT